VVIEHGARDGLAADPTSHFGGLLRTASSGLLADEAVS